MYDPITNKLEGAEAAYEEKRQAFIEECETSVAYATGWKLNAVLEAETVLGVARAFGTDREAQDQFAREFEERTLPYVRGESKSTSQATNLTEDIAFATKARLFGEIREWRKAEARQAELEAERLAEVRQVGQSVRTRVSSDDRSHACLVTRVNEDGTIGVISPSGPQHAGEVPSAPAERFVTTETEPYRAVQIAWERLADMGQLSREVANA